MEIILFSIGICIAIFVFVAVIVQSLIEIANDYYRNKRRKLYG